MQEKLRKFQSDFADRIIESMQECQYRYNRYHQDFAVAMLLDPGLDAEQIAKSIRATDRFIPLDAELGLVIFDQTDAGGGLRAAEKLLHALGPSAQHPVHMVLSGCLPDKQDQAYVRHLFTLMEFALSHNHANEVVDSGYLDAVF